jgi:UPF0176 protein
MPFHDYDRTMFHIAAYYKFFPLLEEDADSLRESLFAFGEEIGISGLVILGSEGINGTVAAETKEVLKQWKDHLEEVFGEITFKDSFADEQPFKRWFVKIRSEIVSLGDTEIVPNGKNNHITPEEWDKMIDSEDVVILDTRNTYETEIGVFEGAVDPKLQCFQEFPEYVEKCGIPKDKKVLMYCTGGIRCEKASMEMLRQGYENVFQLDGGILRYMQERPNKKWQGECFVFDHRVAVNQELKPSERYGLCPHCGDPGDQHIACEQCQKPGMMCVRCIKAMNTQTCSKDCAYRRNLVLQKEAVVR